MSLMMGVGVEDVEDVEEGRLGEGRGGGREGRKKNSDFFSHHGILQKTKDSGPPRVVARCSPGGSFTRLPRLL